MGKISPETIMNCFRHTKFKVDDNDSSGTPVADPVFTDVDLKIVFQNLMNIFMQMIYL